MKVSDQETSASRIKTELLYNTIKPYHIAAIFYVLSLILCLITLKKPQSIIGLSATITFIIAISSQTFGIASRIYILDRPPVGTLYESVLFVSLICAVTGGLFHAKARNKLFFMIGQITALSLLMIAPYTLQNEDSLELLAAVLNTNFWLTTHVLCMTAGYGVCIIAACLGHAYLFINAKNATQKTRQKLFEITHKISLTALLLTAVGTVLGGIWADQSWGRFWGWDPKENGALLIVLWLIWLQHGKISAKLSNNAYMAGMATLNIIVALAWFGVNLLNIGLHSYGFTTGMATGLTVFCTLQICTISLLWFFASHKQNQKTGAAKT